MSGHKKRWLSRTRPAQLQLGLDRVAQPNDRLRADLKDAGLDRVGLDLERIQAHRRALQLVHQAAAAKRRGHLTAARVFARQFLSFKRELS